MWQIGQDIQFLLRNFASRPLSESVALAGVRVKQAANRIAGIPAAPFAVSKAARVSSRLRTRDPRLAVFVSDTPRAREAKLAFGLRSVGWKVVLLHGRKPNFDTAPYFDEIRRCGNEWQALSIACDYSPRVYHVFASFADTQLATAFSTHKPGKTVLDVYDVWEQFKPRPELAQKVAKQRFCFEHADALCCRDLRPNYLGRRRGYTLPSRVIYFPDYCWDAHQIASGSGVLAEKRDLHVVLAGTFGVEKRGFGEGGYLDIARTLTAQGIHFHIYPHSTAIAKKQFEADYVSLSRQTPFLHLHESAAMNELIPELAQYDLGITVTKFLSYHEEPALYDRELLAVTGSARISDYLDAGLPIICNKEMNLVFFTAARYGTALNGSIEFMRNFRHCLGQLSFEYIERKLRQSRSAYSIVKNAGRLVAFYESL